MTFDIIIVAVVILLGIVFLMVEIFLIPGITVSGIAGVVFIGGGIYYAYQYMGQTAGNFTLLFSAILIMASFLYLIKSKSLKRIALNTVIDSKVDTSDLQKINIGDVGTTESRLNPIGKVFINNLTVEAKSMDGEMIDEDTEVKVVKVDWSNIIVTRTENQIN